MKKKQKGQDKLATGREFPQIVVEWVAAPDPAKAISSEIDTQTKELSDSDSSDSDMSAISNSDISHHGQSYWLEALERAFHDAYPAWESSDDEDYI